MPKIPRDNRHLQQTDPRGSIIPSCPEEADIMSNNPINDLFGVESDMRTDESVTLDDPFADAEEVESDTDTDVLAFLNTIIDPEELAAKETALFLQKGLYTWKDSKCELKIDFDDEDKKPTDTMMKNGKNRGRVLMYVSGVVIMKDSNKQGRFNVSCSPDTRKAENGDDDFMSQNYVRFTTQFFKTYERKPANAAEVASFIKSANYSMYITLSKTHRNYLNQVQDLQ